MATKKTSKNSNTTRVVTYKVCDDYKIPTGTTGKIIALIVTLIVGIVAGVAGVNIAINIDGTGATVDGTVRLEFSDEQIPALIEDDQGDITEELYPTVEEVDGGQFEDATTGVSVVDGEYADMGWSETYDVSSPDAFKNDTLGKCIVANNRYGAQCVSLARVFWWSYADRDVSTCGTGAAKGMMNCAEENAGDDFLVYYGESAIIKIQAGDWLVFDGGTWGHVGMALGPVTNGYVALLGENQGGKACIGGGSATNIINISTKNLIGFYRPKSYVKVEPEPEPTPSVPVEPDEPSTGEYIVVKGDTLGDIARNVCGYNGKDLFGDNGYAQKLADHNSIENRGLILPGLVIKCF